MMRATILDVARAAGVTDATVSNVLNGKGRTSEATRQRVLGHAADLGYCRNELARAVVTGKSRILGILTQVRPNEALLLTLAGALEEAAERDYATKLMVLSPDIDQSVVGQVMQRCAAWRLDGALVIGLGDSHLERLRDEMAQSRRPVAFAGTMPPEGSVGAYSDDDCAWRIAVGHLVEQGHRRIAHLGADPTSRLARYRMESCLGVMREFGLPLDEHSATLSSWHNAEQMEAGANRLLDAPQRPTALLCSSDLLAMIAIRVAGRRGFSIPNQLSVVGFGDDTYSQYADPALTSIAQPHEEVARLAMRQLLFQVEGGAQEDAPCHQPQRLRTGYRLSVRGSTAPPLGPLLT